MMQESAIDVAVFLRLVGRRVAEARDRRGLSQSRLATAAGLAVEVLAGLERAEYGIEVDQLHRVAEALGMQTRALLPDYEDVERATG